MEYGNKVKVKLMAERKEEEYICCPCNTIRTNKHF
jgi:hypothetical protein